MQGTAPLTTPSATQAKVLLLPVLFERGSQAEGAWWKAIFSSVCLVFWTLLCYRKGAWPPWWKCNCIAHTLGSVSTWVSPTPHPPPPPSLSTLAEPALLGPHAPWACFTGSRTDNAVSHLPLLLINEFLKYLYRPSHHHKCCFKEGQMVEVNEQQMEHKWSHMSNLTSSVRREAKNQSPSFPMCGGITRTTATATNGCSDFLFKQVTTIDLLRLKTSTCFLWKLWSPWWGEIAFSFS